MIVPVRTTCILPDFIATATIGCSSLSYMEQRESLVPTTIGELLCQSTNAPRANSLVSSRYLPSPIKKR